LKRLFKIEIF